MGFYVNGLAQISIQAPLRDEWMEHPNDYAQTHVRAIEPGFKEYISPATALRMPLIVKRAVVTSVEALRCAEVAQPGAIISATGLGDTEGLERYLQTLSSQGEGLLQPTHFMNSPCSLVAVELAKALGCNAYNNTHIQRNISFESALLEAQMLLKEGRQSVLLSANDEVTSSLFYLYWRLGLWRSHLGSTLGVFKKRHAKGTFAGEGSVSCLLGVSPQTDMAIEVAAVDIMHQPTSEKFECRLKSLLDEAGMSIDEISAIMLGKNGDAVNDMVYEVLRKRFFKKIPTVYYKHLCGEYSTASAFGWYVAVRMLQNGRIPESVLPTQQPKGPVQSILLVNHSQSVDYSLVLLRVQT